MSNKQIPIERLHLCSWDFADLRGLFEVGIEFHVPQGVNKVTFKIAFHFGKLASELFCLKDFLIRNDDNCKLIFNNSISAIKRIKERG